MGVYFQGGAVPQSALISSRGASDAYLLTASIKKNQSGKSMNFFLFWMLGSYEKSMSANLIPLAGEG
jgi:hypothetical protein